MLVIFYSLVLFFEHGYFFAKKFLVLGSVSLESLKKERYLACYLFIINGEEWWNRIESYLPALLACAGRSN
jgi:hypothetical protein